MQVVLGNRTKDQAKQAHLQQKRTQNAHVITRGNTSLNADEPESDDQINRGGDGQNMQHGASG